MFDGSGGVHPRAGAVLRDLRQPAVRLLASLLRTEILQEISAGAENHGLKTVDEAAAQDEATGATLAL